MSKIQTDLTIYKCSGCSIIISSSSNLEEVLEEHGILIFSEASVNKVKTLQTSTSLLDKFCTFQSIICSSCSQPLGRFYKATTLQLTRFCEKFVVERNKLSFSFHNKDEFTKKKFTPTFNNLQSTEISQIQIDKVEKELEFYDPIQEYILLDPYYEFKYIKNTIKIAESSEALFTKGLLTLEKRVQKVEDNSHKVRLMYKTITKAID